MYIKISEFVLSTSTFLTSRFVIWTSESKVSATVPIDFLTLSVYKKAEYCPLTMQSSTVTLLITILANAD